ncbi:HNH endonuclease family protein [Mobiluncus curtisii]|uniref:HNH endonuclease family protein n=1 Tax=Mobiluncus curtisii TaxID=2051 RepID=UPI0021E23112|nr:HNH endonuclease family protein [Mobiluncus curtisii]
MSAFSNFESLKPIRRASVGDVVLIGCAALVWWALWPGAGPNLANFPTPGLRCPSSSTSGATIGGSLHELCALKVRKDAGPDGYQRDLFGAGWMDPDGNGCDTRADILARDFQSPRFGNSAKPCRLTGGTFHDPYTGKTMQFETPPGRKVQIDHVVALGNAWKSGAWAWTKAQREAYANDPSVLLAADGPANQQKSDASADAWMPSNRNFRCAYARQQIDIKYRWNLTVTAPEKAALLSALAKC